MSNHDAAFRRIVSLASAFVKKHPGEALAAVGDKPGWLGASAAQREAIEDAVAEDIATVRRHFDRCTSRIEELEGEIAGDEDDGDEPSYDESAVPEPERAGLGRPAPDDEEVDGDADEPHQCAACAAAKMQEPR